MKKKSDCGCSCKMAEAFKDIYKRLEKLEQILELKEKVDKSFEKDYGSPKYEVTISSEFIPVSDETRGYNPLNSQRRK